MPEDWLLKLKPGDKAILNYGLIGSVDRVVTVSKLTATQIVCIDSDSKQCRFLRRNGHKVGSGVYYSVWLREDSPERRDQVERAQLRAEARRLKDNLAIPSTKEALIELIALLKKYQPSEEINT